MVVSGESAKGASAAPFTNPRRVIPLILMPPAVNRLLVGSNVPVQSLFHFKCFVNNFSLSSQPLRQFANGKNIPAGY
jgi:hypothetical protein